MLKESFLNRILRKHHTKKLEKMITNNCNYSDIVKQSQKLDKYIFDAMKK